MRPFNCKNCKTKLKANIVFILFFFGYFFLFGIVFNIIEGYYEIGDDRLFSLIIIIISFIIVSKSKTEFLIENY